MQFLKWGPGLRFLGKTFFPGGIRHAQDIQTPVYTVPVRNIEQEYAVIHLTDLHLDTVDHVVSSALLAKRLTHIAALLEEKNIPSTRRLLLCTGDFVSGETYFAQESVLDDFLSFCDVLRDFPADQSYFVLGNHDLRHSQAEKLKKLLEQKAQMTHLCGTAFFGDICLVGLPDYREERPKITPSLLQEVLDLIPQQPFSLVCAHNPDIFQHFGQASGTFFALAGHTHGSAWDLPVFRKLLLKGPLKLQSNYVRGFYDIGQNGQLYVCSGAGTQHQVPHRFGPKARPEIPVFVFRKST